MATRRFEYYQEHYRPPPAQGYSNYFHRSHQHQYQNSYPEQLYDGRKEHGGRQDTPRYLRQAASSQYSTRSSQYASAQPPQYFQSPYSRGEPQRNFRPIEQNSSRDFQPWGRSASERPEPRREYQPQQPTPLPVRNSPPDTVIHTGQQISHPSSFPHRAQEGEVLYQRLQAKARASYVRLQRTKGHLRTQKIAFFIINESPGLHNELLGTVAQFRERGRQFGLEWINVGRELSYRGKPEKPAIIIASDDLFISNDELLKSKAKDHAFEGFQSKDRYGRNQLDSMDFISSGVFNGSFEPQNISISDYLLGFQHQLLSFRMVERLLNYWECGDVGWHIDRGLKLSLAGGPPKNQHELPVSRETANQMSKHHRLSFYEECKLSLFCVSGIRAGSLTSDMVSSGLNAQNTKYAHAVHYFYQNTGQFQREMRQKYGTTINVGKYDIPSFNLNAPLGTSIFQMQNERQYADENKAVLNSKYKETRIKAFRKKDKKEKHPVIINEPRPGPNHVICAVCQKAFPDYIEHIFSDQHRQGVKDSSKVFNWIDAVTQEIAEFQNTKEILEAEKQLDEQAQILHNRMRTNQRALNQSTSTEDAGAPSKTKGDAREHPDKISINIESDSTKPRKRAQKAELKKSKVPTTFSALQQQLKLDEVTKESSRRVTRETSKQVENTEPSSSGEELSFGDVLESFDKNSIHEEALNPEDGPVPSQAPPSLKQHKTKLDKQEAQKKPRRVKDSQQDYEAKPSSRVVGKKRQMPQRSTRATTAAQAAATGKKQRKTI